MLGASGHAPGSFALLLADFNRAVARVDLDRRLGVLADRPSQTMLAGFLVLVHGEVALDAAVACRCIKVKLGVRRQRQGNLSVARLKRVVSVVQSARELNGPV